MNPFDLPGPQFLMFYGAVVLISALTVHICWILLDDSSRLTRPLRDPYMIAYLRGGPHEAIKAATASLIHREWLTNKGKALTSDGRHYGHVNNELESAILRSCNSGSSFEKLVSGECIDIAVDMFERILLKEHLLLSKSQKLKLMFARMFLIYLLLCIAGYKIYLAILRGRHNIEFLIVLAFVGCLFHILYHPRCTLKGKTALKDLRAFFGKLKGQPRRLVSSTHNPQFSLLVAIFGVAAAPLIEFPFLSALKPPPNYSSNGSDSSSGCGSSCSSGCGGGGGCGGCGS